MLLMSPLVQISFNNELDKFSYNFEVEFVRKEVKKALLKGKLKYNVSKGDLKKWYCKYLFKYNFLENISCEDLYFVAEELCNIKLD